MTTTNCLNGELIPGDQVLVTPENHYGCLVGTVLEMHKAGTPEHQAATCNPGDGIHVNFAGVEYPQWRKEEIEEQFSFNYGRKCRFSELPLDDAILEPDSLIRINCVKPDKLKEILDSYENAYDYCKEILREQSLMDRISQNIADYHTHWARQDQEEIYDAAGMIAAVKDTYYYLTDVHIFEPEEVEYLLKFENPLEVVADEWNLRREDMSDFSFALDHVCDKREALEGGYELTAEAALERAPGLRRSEDREDLSR